VPIHGRPLLDYWLKALFDFGVEEVLINTHYMASTVEHFVQQSAWKEKIKIVHEEQLQGTGGTILTNRSFFHEETFLVAHADNLTIFNMEDFVSSHSARPAGTDLTMMLFESDNPQSCGIVELNSKGVVEAFHEKVNTPHGNLANAAVYLLEPVILEMMASLGKTEIDFSTEIIPKLLGKIFTYRNTIYHRDIGTMKSWSDANMDFPNFERNAG
jgi:mannose-1-phosphate guanylyltransferase